MYKLPKGIKIVIFILLLGLQFFILTLIRTAYTGHESEGYVLKFTESEYYIIFSISSIVALFIGMAFIFNMRAWEVNDLIEKMDNILFINNTIIALYQRKCELMIKLPNLCKIPDPVRVSIMPHNPATGKGIK